MPYLVWEGSEIATKDRRGWKCFCGKREDWEHEMHLHLEIDHQIVGVVLRQDDENYDGQRI